MTMPADCETDAVRLRETLAKALARNGVLVDPAWRAAVVPISPRFASARTGMSAGIPARNRSSAAMPADPNASKKARFGFTAAACGM